MAAVTFSYHSKKDKSPLEIRLSFTTLQKQRFSFYCRSRIEVDRDYWENKHFQADFPNYRDIEKINEVKTIKEQQIEVNAEIDGLRKHILIAFNKIPSNSICEIVNAEWLKQTVSFYYNPPIQSTGSHIPFTLLEYVDYYLRMNKHIKEGTRKKFITVKNRIINHLEQLNYNRPILLSDINDEFKDRFYNVFATYSSNTIEYALKNIKTLCLHARKKGLDIHNDVLEWEFKFAPTPIIYLNFEELKALKNLNELPNYLDNARDWLLISCYTGQRVSDFMRFDKSMIRTEMNVHGKEVNLIEFTQVKTESTISIPLHSEVLRILKKYNGNFPHSISDQKYNNYIKTVCKLADLTQLTYGGKQVKINRKQYRKILGNYPKYELVTSHIGRRSFATNNFGKIPTRLIMSATGHQTEKEFLKYIGKSNTELSKSLADYF